MDISTLEFVALALATWRTAFFFVYDDGPFMFMQWIRERLGLLYDDGGLLVSIPDWFPASLFACVMCMSAWTGAAIYGIFVLEPKVVLVLGLWGAATGFERIKE